MALDTFFKMMNRPGVEQVRQNQIQAQLDRKMANEAAQRNVIAELLSNRSKQISNRRTDLSNTQTALEMAQFGKPTYGDLVQQPDGSFAQPKLDRQGRVSGINSVPGLQARVLHPAKQELAKFLDPNLDPYTATDAQYMAAKKERDRVKLETNPTYMYRQQLRQEAEQKQKEDKKEAREFASDTYEIAARMFESDGLDAAVGTVDVLFPTFGEDAIGFENDLEFLVSRLTKENLGIMKGVLSDNDIKMLRNIGAGELTLKGGEQRMRTGLMRVMNKLAVASGRPVPYANLENQNRAAQNANSNVAGPASNQSGSSTSDLGGSRFTIEEI